MGILAQLKILQNSEIIPNFFFFHLFLGKLERRTKKNNLVAILFITNKFDSLFFIKTNTKQI